MATTLSEFKIRFAVMPWSRPKVVETRQQTAASQAGRHVLYLYGETRHRSVEDIQGVYLLESARRNAGYYSVVVKEEGVEGGGCYWFARVDGHAEVHTSLLRFQVLISVWVSSGNI